MGKQHGVWIGLAIVAWIVVVGALVFWTHDAAHPIGWDLAVYKAAAQSLRAGHDPYLDAMAIQRQFHAQGPHPFGVRIPFSYVYPPLTLPFARPFAAAFAWVYESAYWILYGLSALVPVFLALWIAADQREKYLCWIIAPLSLVLPGFIESNVIFSGNVAYILHGLVLLGAWAGWKKDRWVWFYLAVLLASCFKAPMLYLLAIPLLSSRRQWMGAGLTALAGVLLLGSQFFLFPALFRNYLTAVELQFSFNQDFSSSPVGLLADALYFKVPYQLTTAIFYPISAGLFLLLLVLLRRRFLAGQFGLREWIPLVVVGVALLNPRIMEYDIAALTTVMALLLWRSLRRWLPAWGAALTLVAILGVLQFPGAQAWRPTACVTLVTLFFLGFASRYLEPRDDDATEVA